MNIEDLFSQLKGDNFEHTFKVVPISGFLGSYIGVNTSGWPSLFVDCSLDKSLGPSMRTTHISLQLGNEYKISISGMPPIIEKLDLLICESNVDIDVHTFLSLIGGFLGFIHDNKIKRSDLLTFFLSVSKLFSINPSNDVITERQGLWGELFFMSQVKGFKFWLPYWHSEPSRKFDFSSSDKRVEVKTTTGSERIHQFSHRQVYSFEGEEIIVASIMLRYEDSGISLRDLLNIAKNNINSESDLVKLVKAERISKMESQDELGPIFDALEAERSLSLFWANKIPHFGEPEPSGVSKTHYQIDLSTTPCINIPDLDDWLSKWN